MHDRGGGRLYDEGCPEGQEPFLSQAVLHQVHLFIFFLAICHVLYTASVLHLGKRRLSVMLEKRRRHVDRTMIRIAKIVDSDAHALTSGGGGGDAKHHPNANANASAGLAPDDVAVAVDVKTEKEKEKKKEKNRNLHSATESNVAKTTSLALKGQMEYGDIVRGKGGGGENLLAQPL